MERGKVFLIGIDGGSWELMLPLVEMGLMPGMGELISGGLHGNLLSTIPYITCPAWNCLASGKNPGWIGTFGFLNLEPSTYDLSYYDYHVDPEVPELWDLLEGEGLTSGVLNNPVVRNPRPVNGYMVPGFLADDRDYRTYPGSLRRFLDDACGGYEIEPRGFSIKEPRKTIRECERAMDKRYRAMRILLAEHPTDLFFGVFHLADRVCHSVLNLTGLPLDPHKDELSASAARFFGKLDGYIASLVDEFVGERDLLVILSDHGFAPCRRGFLLNSWLIEEGYLHVRPLRGLSGMGINQRRIAGVLERVGLLDPVLRLTPRSLKKIVPKGVGSGTHVSVVDMVQSARVDWTRSLAVGFPNNGIYINTEDRPEGAVARGEEREALMEELRRKLTTFQDPETGERPVLEVHRREELYSGPRMERAPDLIVETAKGWTTQMVIGAKGELIIPISRADHRREGVFLLRAAGVLTGSAEAHIEDIAPTVLDFMGLESSTAMDGRTLLR